MFIMSRLGETIRAARIKAKMTEKTLAKKCGMAENVIKAIEMGTRIVSDDQAQRILKILGVSNPISTELEVASEPEVKLRPRPRAYVIPTPEPEAAVASSTKSTEPDQVTDAWLDALGGVVKRVPVMDENGVAIDHVLTPIVGGTIEGGAPDKVIYYRCPDDMLRGYRIHAGDLLLTVPAGKIEDEAIMLLVYKGRRIVRKVNKLDGGRVLLQSYDREFATVTVQLKDVLVMGKCVKLVRELI
jgi:transcriptional regulator with XRE-family HTH domain